jgi:hypothetical protein
MDVRLDSSLGSWGRFGVNDRELAPGRLSYDPAKGLALELLGLESAPRLQRLLQGWGAPFVLGRLMDGTPVSVFDCVVQSMSFGAGAAGPVVLKPTKAVFGAHVDALEAVKLRYYAIELSSLQNWTGTSPARLAVRRKSRLDNAG